MNSQLEVRHAQRRDEDEDKIVNSAARLVDQAHTGAPETKWLYPLVKAPPSIDSPSPTYVFRKPPPTRRSVSQALPGISPLTLLDWDTPATQAESLGLPGLDEFVSGIEWSRPCPTAAAQQSSKRRQPINQLDVSTDTHAKRPRLVLAKPAASLPALQALIIQRGVATHLRLGLQKRSGQTAKTSSKPKRQLGPGPPRVLVDNLDTQILPSVTEAAGLSTQSPDHVPVPIVLVPSTPSPGGKSLSSVRNNCWMGSQIGASVLYDSSPDISQDGTHPSMEPVTGDLMQAAYQGTRVEVSIPDDEASLEVSRTPAPTSARFQESLLQAQRLSKSPIRPNLSNRLVASVMYESSEGSGETSKLHTSYSSIALPLSFDNNVSSRELRDTSESLEFLDSGVRVAELQSVELLALSHDPIEQNTPSGSKQLGPTGLGMISALYNSSQYSPQILEEQSPRNREPALPHEPGSSTLQALHEPEPSWSTDQSSQLRPPSGIPPSGSWLPLSLEGLVTASRSLSLEDFDNQMKPPSGSSSSLLVYPAKLPLEPRGSGLNHTPPVPRLMSPRLVSYLSSEEDSIRSVTPGPYPKRNVDINDSIESITSFPHGVLHSPSISIRGIVPAFHLPAPVGSKLEDDISFESQRQPPAHGTLGSLPEMIDSSTSEQNVNKPNFEDALPPLEGRSPVGVIPAVESSSPLDYQGSSPPVYPNIKIFKGSLHNLIPPPHLLSSLACPAPSLTEGVLAALEPAQVYTWFDERGHTRNDISPDEFGRDPWRRAAWVIPIRGRPSWEDCSSAVITSRPKDGAKRSKRTIVWTPAAVRSLWAQLSGFRESRRVGSLGISFTSGVTEQGFEFVKVYHEIRVSLKLRTILKVLEFPDWDGYGMDAETPLEEEGAGGTRRLLGSGTRLTLVDDTGRVILVS